MDDLIDIADVAESAGLTTSALRYYERRRLIEPAGRHGLRRQYRPETVRVLKLITLLQGVGMTLEEIRQLLNPHLRANHGWRSTMEEKSRELRLRLKQTETALAGVQHALECSRPDLLDCPQFAQLLD